MHLRLRDNAEFVAAGFPALLIRAERIAMSIIHGVHGRRQAGPGEDFWQYRHYSPGDAASRIDWRKSAHSHKVLIRENEWAATNALWLWQSRSPGMGFESELAQESKADRAALILMALATLAVKAGERIAGLGSEYNPDHTSRALDRLARWLGTELSEDEALPPTIALPRFSSCVLISDFMQPLADIRTHLHRLAENGVQGHIVQITDPAEETLPYEGRTEFLPFSGQGRLVFGRPGTLRQEYVERLQLHRAGLADIATSLGWSFTQHRSDQPVQTVLLALYAKVSGDMRALSSAAQKGYAR